MSPMTQYFQNSPDKYGMLRLPGNDLLFLQEKKHSKTSQKPQLNLENVCKIFSGTKLETCWSVLGVHGSGMSLRCHSFPKKKKWSASKGLGSKYPRLRDTEGGRWQHRPCQQGASTSECTDSCGTARMGSSPARMSSSKVGRIRLLTSFESDRAIHQVLKKNS